PASVADRPVRHLRGALLVAGALHRRVDANPRVAGLARAAVLRGPAGHAGVARLVAEGRLRRAVVVVAADAAHAGARGAAAGAAVVVGEAGDAGAAPPIAEGARRVLEAVGVDLAPGGRLRNLALPAFAGDAVEALGADDATAGILLRILVATGGEEERGGE